MELLLTAFSFGLSDILLLNEKYKIEPENE